jgi:hypothetical protein
VLSGYEAQPSRQVPAILEGARVTDRSHDSSGCQRADAFDRADLAAQLATGHQPPYSGVGFFDTPLDDVEMLQRLDEQAPACCREFASAASTAGMALWNAAGLGDDDTASRPGCPRRWLMTAALMHES